MRFSLILNLILLAAFITILILYIRKQRLFSGLFRALKKSKQHLLQLNTLRDSMLEITQAVVGTDNPKDLYDMILSKTIRAIPNANLGSVLTKGEDGLFRCSSQKGFDHEKMNAFKLSLEETILWKYTKGKISHTEIINNVENIQDLDIHPLALSPEEWTIQSTISAPLFMGEEIIGLLNIDSKENDAFNHDDWTSMEYIRGNIEVALQKHSLYTKILTLSRFDLLTGVFTRAYFMEQFERALYNAERYRQPFSLVIFDINDLKIINDTKGHIAGDKIIRHLAQSTVKGIRKSDIFARWGGDEFMGLFYHMEEGEIEEKIQSIKLRLHRIPLLINNEEVPCHFSYGYAHYPDEGNNFDDLLKIADEKMYRNKRKMKNPEK